MILTNGRDSVVGEVTRYWLVRGLKPGAGETFRNRPDRLWGPPSLLHMCVPGLFPGSNAAGTWC